ncbi:GNAT family N-acetyltransferase [Methylobacterium symbioticum]
MAVLVEEAERGALGRTARRARAGALSGDVLPDLAAAEIPWRALEALPGALGTPYQRFDWAAAFAAALAPGEACRVLILRDAAERVRLLLPLVLRRRGGLTIASVIGGAHANYHLPLFSGRDAAALPAEELRLALRAAGRRAGIDVIDLGNQPRTWDGTVNPLALGADPAPSDGYGMMLGPDPEASVRRAFGGDARKKLRSKERRLVETVGPLAYRCAETAEERARFLAAFHAQKAARFAAMGIGDPFADGAVRAFLDRAAAGETPAIEVHALVAETTGRVLATFTGAVDAARFSGMTTSFEADPEVARSSPGDLLLQHLVRDQTARGRRSLDLGIGEARYKASVCDETIEIARPILAVTLRGHAYRAAAAALTRAKRRIKRDPRLAGLRARLAKLRG